MAILQEISRDTERELYRYFSEKRASVPYYYMVGFDAWRDSMFDDRGTDGKPLFSQLKTFLLSDAGHIIGFIQFGLTSFVLDAKGERDYSSGYGIIRNMHFDCEKAGYASILLSKADEYFSARQIAQRYAFFHFFGMSCYARQGKLHESEFHVEKALREYGYVQEHENVYYAKSLESGEDVLTDIEFCHDDDSHIIFLKNGNAIGDCELRFLPGAISYLVWIGINSDFAHQGYGTQCMHKLFDELRQKGIARLDTDTPSNNFAAQGFYIKTGFQDKGRTRSYHTIPVN